MSELAKWYVVHTYSGYENSVAANILKAAENRKMQDLIQEVNIPMETVKEITDSGEKTVSIGMLTSWLRSCILRFSAAFRMFAATLFS